MIGNVSDVRQDTRAALSYLEKAIEITEEHFGANHPRIWQIRQNLPLVYQHAGELRKAADLALQILQHYSTHEPDNYSLKLQLEANLSELYFEMEGKTDSALSMAEQAHQEGLKVYGPKFATQAFLMYQMARCYKKMGMTDLALTTVQDALIASSKTFSSREVLINPSIEELEGKTDLFDLLLLKADLLLKKTSCPACLPAALDALRLGAGIIRENHLQTGMRTDSEWNTNIAEYFEDALQTLGQHLPAARSPEGIELCFSLMENAKAIRLSLALQESEARSVSGIPDSLLKFDELLTRDILYYEKQLSDAQANQDTLAIRFWRDEKLFSVREKRKEFLKKIEQDYPVYFEKKYQNSFTTLSGLQLALAPDEIFLSYALCQSRRDSNIFLIAADSRNVRFYRINWLPNFEQKIRRLHQLLKSPNSGRTAARKEWTGICAELYQLLLAPAAQQLVGKKKIIIAGEDLTYYLPFEMLLSAYEDRSVQNLDFLVKNFTISYSYSASLWVKPRANRQYDTALLAFAPVFSTASPDAEGDGLNRTLPLGGSWRPLPFSEAEVREITQHFKNNRLKTSVLLRENATKQQLLSALGTGARIVHIASHSFINTQYPKFSGIACFSNDTATDNTVLFLGDIYRKTFNADLAVLSSCESGLGKLVGGEGLLGLNRAFYYAGVPNVLFSLWKVNDRATHDLMDYFYQAVAQGKPYAEALQSAKLSMMANPATAAPDFWSGFIFIGQ